MTKFTLRLLPVGDNVIFSITEGSEYTSAKPLITLSMTKGEWSKLLAREQVTITVPA